jgi:hypothetical protein
MARRRLAPTVWKNRMTRHALVAPETLLASPDNYRRHPRWQAETLEQILDRVGWVGPVLVSERTGQIVDGHLRVEVAQRRGEAQIPVAYLDLSPEEERLVLATYDPLAGLAEIDQPGLDRLLADLVAGDAQLQGLLAGLHADQGLEPPDHALDIPVQHLPPDGGAADDEIPLAGGDTIALPAPQIAYPSELPWDLPALLPDRLAAIPFPLADQEIVDRPDPAAAWGLWVQRAGWPQALDAPHTLACWYGDPSRAERFWHAPEAEVEALTRRGQTTVISPWFPLDPQTPRAVQLYQVFRARWCARYLQECGLSVIPDLTLCRSPQANPTPGVGDWWLLGLADLPAVSVYLPLPRRRADLSRTADVLTAALNAVRPQSLLCYGPPTALEVLEAVSPGCPLTVVAQRPPKRFERLARRD